MPESQITPYFSCETNSVELIRPLQTCQKKFSSGKSRNSEISEVFQTIQFCSKTTGCPPLCKQMSALGSRFNNAISDISIQWVQECCHKFSLDLKKIFIKKMSWKLEEDFIRLKWQLLQYSLQI